MLDTAMPNNNAPSFHSLFKGSGMLDATKVRTPVLFAPCLYSLQATQLCPHIAVDSQEAAAWKTTSGSG